MANVTESDTIDVAVVTHGKLPGAADYVQTKIGGIGRYAHRPIRHVRVKLTRHQDPAVERPVVAQGNVDVDGRTIRAQVEGQTVREAVDRLEDRLRQRLVRLAEREQDRRVRPPAEADRAHRPSYFPRPEADREVVRHKSYTLARADVEEAAWEMELLDYDFHLFTEANTGQDCVLYRDENGYRLASVRPITAEQLQPFELPLSISEHPAPELTVDEARERLGMLWTSFLFFINAETGRGNVLYHRYDGNYGLIAPAD